MFWRAFFVREHEARRASSYLGDFPPEEEEEDEEGGGSSGATADISALQPPEMDYEEAI